MIVTPMILLWYGVRLYSLFSSLLLLLFPLSLYIFVCLHSAAKLKCGSTDTNLEPIWAKINLLNPTPLYICSYYQPPHSDVQPILELNESMDNQSGNIQTVANFIVAGDFNLPSIEWTNGQGSILPNLTYGYNLNEVFIDVIAK